MPCRHRHTLRHGHRARWLGRGRIAGHILRGGSVPRRRPGVCARRAGRSGRPGRWPPSSLPASHRDGVGPGGHGRIHVLFARQPADLDACAGRGGSGGAQPAAGPPQGGLGPLGGQRTTRSGERGGNIGHGSQSYAAVRAGRPHDCAYTGPRKYSPSGEKVGAATLRERACSTSAIHSGRWLP